MSKFIPPHQNPLPNSPVNNSWHGLSRDQLLQDLKVVYENQLAWGKRPVGGFPSGYEQQYETCGYALAGLNAALGGNLHDNLVAAGIANPVGPRG